MTQEEKSKRYDEALERAKKELGTCGSYDCDAARQIFRLFPELQESEDEKIRKALLEYFGEECDTATINGIYCYKIYAWLEKQGKKSPFNKERLMEVAKPETFEEQIEHWQRMRHIAEKRVKELLENQDEQKNKITFEDVLALECAMKTVKITEGGNELYEMLVSLYNKIYNTHLDEKTK